MEAEAEAMAVCSGRRVERLRRAPARRRGWESVRGRDMLVALLVVVVVLVCRK